MLKNDTIGSAQGGKDQTKYPQVEQFSQPSFVDRVYIGEKGYVENLDMSQVTQDVVQRIFEIEQDMWSHGLGSYISCNGCGTISSKQDVYSHLDSDIQKQTVHDLETDLGAGHPHCPSCGSGDTTHVFDEQYRDESIAARYQFNESFLTVFRDVSGKIQGFTNAYISDYDTIYAKEFEPFYGIENKDVVAQKVCQILQTDEMPDQLVGMNTVGATQGYVSLPLIYELLKSLCFSMYPQYGHLHSVYDSILGNATNGIYTVSGGQRLYVSDSLDPSAINQDFPTDMMFQKNIVRTFLETFGPSSRYFFKQHSKAIKNIRKG